jgi:hypothetical protein
MSLDSLNKKSRRLFTWRAPHLSPTEVRSLDVTMICETVH